MSLDKKPYRQFSADARRVVVLGLSLLGHLLASPGSAESGYQRRAEVEDQLTAWSKKYPQVLTLETIGTSAGGHPLQVVRLASPGPLPHDLRPAVFVGANLVGFHPAGTAAALHLIAALLTGEAPGLLQNATFYVAPILNPDAHDQLFTVPKNQRRGNAQAVDEDRDGLEGEDDCDDLDGDGRITQLRILDPAGDWYPDPLDPRLLVRADPQQGTRGRFRVESEGRDDDGDGLWNEDPPGGLVLDSNFPHAFPYPEVTAGLWPGYAPEVYALFEFFFTHRHLALAILYGPANSLLALPQTERTRDRGPQQYRPPAELASFLGLEPTHEYTLDELWAAARDQPSVRENGIRKEHLGQFLDLGPETGMAPEDLVLFSRLAQEYRARLVHFGQDTTRPASSPTAGSMAHWLYFQAGVLAVELDVWGVPAGPEAAADSPPDPLRERQRQLLAWVDQQAPEGFTPWTKVTLPNGVEAEVGGLDPLLAFTPPQTLLTPALAAHTATVLALAEQLARVELAELTVQPLDRGIYRVSAVAQNVGRLPTQSQMATRAFTRLPVRLRLETGPGAKRLSGPSLVVSERLSSGSTIAGSWLVQARPGAGVSVDVLTESAGRASKTVTFPSSQEER